MDLTAGMNADYEMLATVRWKLCMIALAFLLFPLLSFNAGSSRAPRPPGPMLLLRVRREGFLGDRDGALPKAELAMRPSAMFSLPASWAIVVGWSSAAGIEAGQLQSCAVC